jgi:cytochrome d ubiquinol oxidase subunit II
MERLLGRGIRRSEHVDATFLGAALGIVLRGVPLDATGYFDMPLFTHFKTHPPVGILDWHTLLIGIFVLLNVTGHGAAFRRPYGLDRSDALALVFWGLLRGRFRYAFLGSSGFIMGIFVATAGCCFPVMLKSSVSVAFNLNAYNAASGTLELRSAL